MGKPCHDIAVDFSRPLVENVSLAEAGQMHMSGEELNTNYRQGYMESLRVGAHVVDKRGQRTKSALKSAPDMLQELGDKVFGAPRSSLLIRGSLHRIDGQPANDKSLRSHDEAGIVLLNTNGDVMASGVPTMKFG